MVIRRAIQAHHLNSVFQLGILLDLTYVSASENFTLLVEDRDVLKVELVLFTSVNRFKLLILT